MNAVVYVRVSFEDQVQGTSLDTQEKNCIAYCEAHELNVAAVFREAGASAKSADRPELKKAIAFSTSRRNKVDTFVVYKVDRFARNAEDHFTIRRQLLGAGVVLRSVTEQIGNDPSQKFMETLLAATAEFDNSVRAVRCTEGMSARINAGIWPWGAPLGYRMSPDRLPGEKKRVPDVPDEATFPILQKALQEFALGLHNQASFAARLDALGLAKVRGRKTSLQFANLLLSEERIRFYGGELFNPWTAEYVTAAHTPMLTRAETLYLLTYRKLGRPPRVRVKADDIFPLRGGTVLCGDCGHRLTASTPRGNGGRYHYYHCYNKACARCGHSIAKRDLEAAFVAKLAEIAPTPAFSKAFKEAVLEEWERLAKNGRAIRATREKQLKRLKERKKAIFDRYEEGTYTKAEFVERRKLIENDILALTVDRNEIHMDQVNYEEALEIAMTFLENIGTHWQRQPTHLQRRFQKLVYPEGVPYTPENGFGTAKLGLIFELNQNFDGQKSTLVDLALFHWNQLGAELSHISSILLTKSTGNTQHYASQIF